MKKYWWAILAFLGFGAWFIGQGLEIYGQWPACRLCHVERWIFLALGIMAFLKIIFKKICGFNGWQNLWAKCIAITAAAGSGIAGYHTAIQFHWITLPKFCQLPEADTLEQFMTLPTAACDQWTLSFLFLPVPLYLCFFWMLVSYASLRLLKKESYTSIHSNRLHF